MTGKLPCKWWSETRLVPRRVYLRGALTDAAPVKTVIMATPEEWYGLHHRDHEPALVVDEKDYRDAMSLKEASEILRLMAEKLDEGRDAHARLLFETWGQEAIETVLANLPERKK